MLKKADGGATVHATNKQFGKGPGVTNHPLKKSTVNPVQPNVDEGKSHKAGKPKIAPQATEKKGASIGKHTVLVNEGKPAGRNSTSSTYTAPRGKESSDPLQCGYTRPGKM